MEGSVSEEDDSTERESQRRVVPLGPVPLVRGKKKDRKSPLFEREKPKLSLGTRGLPWGRFLPGRKRLFLTEGGREKTQSFQKKKDSETPDAPAIQPKGEGNRGR